MSSIPLEVLDQVVLEIKNLTPEELKEALEKTKDSVFAKTVDDLIQFSKELEEES